MPDIRPSKQHDSAHCLTRRSLLAGAAAACLAPAAHAGTQAARSVRRVPFGAAVELRPFRTDVHYTELLKQHCDLIFPMNALKWDSLRYKRDVFNFPPAEEIVAFADRLGRRSHGHTFLWYNALPVWTAALSTPAEAERVLVEHIEHTGGHFAGRLESWDVVNEVVAFDPRSEGPWRSGLWFELLGPDHVEIAFRAARVADPQALLGINDFDLEFEGERYDRRRQIVLDIVRHLQDRGVGVDYVGLQGHLYPEVPIDGRATGMFIRELERLGVGYMITELDVIDWKLPLEVEPRDRMAAQHVDDFLDATFSAALPISLATWGLSDRYSWIADVMPHRGGGQSRPLPFDAELRPKPMFQVIERYLAG